MQTGSEPQPFHHYRYAGLAIAAGFPLPELPASAHAPAQLAARITRLDDEPRVEADAIAAGHTWPDTDGNPALHGERWRDGRHCLRFPEVGAALLDPATGDIALWRAADASEESLRHVLLDQALPRLFAGRSELMLHGSAVATPGGRRLALLGLSGYGKSTLASAFERHGGAALADDCLRLECSGERALAFPTYPGLRLWPDSLDALPAARRAQATPMAHYSEKQRVPAASTATDAQPALDAILLLASPDEDDGSFALAPLPQREACMALVGNAFQLDPADLARVGRLLAAAASIAQRVPTCALRHPREYDALADVVERISTRFDAPGDASDPL